MSKLSAGSWSLYQCQQEQTLVWKFPSCLSESNLWLFLECMPSLAALRELSGEGMVPKFLLWDFRQPSAFILSHRAPDKRVIDRRLDCAPVLIPSPISCINFSNFSELIFFKSVTGVRNTYTG